MALQRGLEGATEVFVAFIDGDGQDDPRDLAAMVEKARAGHEFVNGSKFIGRIEEGGISRLNFFGNRFMTVLINALFGTRVTDSQSGLRVIARRVIDGRQYLSREYEIETEMLCRAIKDGVTVIEMPVTRRAREGGRTGFRRVRNGLRILMTILRERVTR
ncbi:MAG: glycosyltransferase family 2 protein [Deltaproteobacteria bacterium]|nr:glycosyltransferase family 2 protein [Deltaproteobacteria bacterium]